MAFSLGDAMGEDAWVLHDSLEVLQSAAEPYLLTAQGRLGGHEVSCHFAPDAGRGVEFRVFLDGRPVYELGQPAPARAWYRLVRDQGFDPELHWDLDPALILFRQVVPLLARDWGEQPLPFNELGVPDGVVCLASVQYAWRRGVAHLEEQARGHPAREQAAACLRDLPPRAVVFHDDPAHREDYVGTGMDEPLLGMFLRLGRERGHRITLAKATLDGTGGLRWSPWEPGGAWREEGREFHATRVPRDFLAAAGLDAEPAEGFDQAFRAELAALMKVVEPAVQAYCRACPEGVPWHRDPFTRYLNHMIVDVRLRGGGVHLVLDDGTEVEVVRQS
jgi:hypothetical protein